MKRFLILALILALAGCATPNVEEQLEIISDVVKELAPEESTFTWDGPLNPNEFDDETKWQYVGAVPAGPFHIWGIIKSMDEAAPIPFVALLIDAGQNVVMYRYFKDNEPCGYVFDTTKKHYGKYEYSQEERQQCMQCHEELTSKTSI